MNQPKIGRPPLLESERANYQIQLRVTRKRKAAYVRWSVRQKKTLARAIFDALDRESGFDDGKELTSEAQ